MSYTPKTEYPRELAEMPPQDFAQELIRALKTVRHHLPTGEVKAWFDDLHREQVARLALLPQEFPAQVFSFEVPGYIHIGPVGQTVAVPDPAPAWKWPEGTSLFGVGKKPRLYGLRVAEEIFLHGERAPVLLRASDFGVSANALREAVTVAASGFVEPFSPLLARAMRSISFNKDGAPSYTFPLQVLLEIPR